VRRGLPEHERVVRQVLRGLRSWPGLPGMVRGLGQAEREAVILRTWEPLLVPGLLQTADYARALFKAWSVTGDENEVSSSSRAADRQTISTGPSHRRSGRDGRGCAAALYRRPQVMHGQLLHLAELAERPAVKVHVIPSE